MDPTDQTPDVPETLTPQAAPPAEAETAAPAPEPAAPDPVFSPAPQAQPNPGEQIRRRALANVMQALDQAPVGDTDPDRLATALGWPVPAVQADPDWSWRHLQLRDAGPIVKSATGLAAWLADDPYNAVIGHRHLEPLAQAEGSVRRALAALDGAAQALKATSLPGSPARLQAFIGRLMQPPDGARSTSDAALLTAHLANLVFAEPDGSSSQRAGPALEETPPEASQRARNSWASEAVEPAMRPGATANAGERGEDRLRAFADATRASSPDGAARLLRVDDRREPRVDSRDLGEPDALVAKLAPTKGPNPFGFFVDEHGRVLHIVFDGYRAPPGKLLPELQSHLEPVSHEEKQRYIGWLLDLKRDMAPGVMSEEELTARQRLSAKDRAKAALPGLNGHGYAPIAGDEEMLARMIFAEGYDLTPEDYDAIGWATINRVGVRRYGMDLDGVRRHHGGFQIVKEGGGGPKGSRAWRLSEHPDKLTGNDLILWNLASASAHNILSGRTPDPTNGANLFFSSDSFDPKNPETAQGDFRRMLRDHLIDPSTYKSQSRASTKNYFYVEPVISRKPRRTP